MLEMLAIAPEDGWAYVRKDGQTWLLRPPYSHANASLVNEQAVQTAVQHYAFQACPKQFSDWNALVEFLNQQVVASRQAKGQPLPTDPIGPQLLEVAPTQVLAAYLDRIEAELLPHQQWDHAEQLLFDMLRVKAVSNDNALYQRTVDLLRRLAVQRKESASIRQRHIQEQTDEEAVFPYAVRRFGQDALAQLAQSIAQRGHVFNFAA